MRLLMLTCLLAIAYGSSDEKCAFGESYWCSSLKTASQCGAFDHCMDTVWIHKKLDKDTTDVCQFCESIIKDVRTFVDDKNNQQQVKTFMDNACNIIPDQQLADMCKTTLNDQFDELIKMIDSNLDPATVCAAWGLCKGFEDKVNHHETVKSLQQTSPVKNEVCDSCKMFINDVKAQVSDKTTQDELKQLLEEVVCAQMPSSVVDLCKVAVDTYLPQLFEMIKSADATKICTMLGFCTNQKLILAKVKLQQSPLYAVVKAGSAEECLLCKTVFAELQNLDRDQTVQADVENFVKNNLCALLGSYKQQCSSMVDQFGPELFELLVNELDPQERCSSLGLCTSSQGIVRAATLLMPAKSAPPKVSTKAVKAAPSTQCVLCEFVIKTLDSQLSDNATEAEIVHALDEVCSVLPDTLKAPCEQFVDQYGPTVIALLLQELNPEQVCTKLGLCSAAAAAVKVDASAGCILCEFVVKELDQLLETNATEQEIVAALDKVCSILPSSITQNCLDFVNTYGPAVIALLEQELDPTMICSTIGLCRNTSVAKPLIKNAETCGVCETVIQYLDSLLEENATETEVEQLLEKICNFLPQNTQKECDSLIAQYGPMLIDLLAKELDPKVICTALDLCSQNKESNGIDMMEIKPAKVNLLGENECTEGPAYWCLNMKNAQKCNGVDHCKKHVWN